MTHEPECPVVVGRYDTAPSCDECDRLRAAYQRGREDAADAVMNKPVPFGLDHMELFRFNCAEAARGDGEQA